MIYTPVWRRLETWLVLAAAVVALSCGGVRPPTPPPPSPTPSTSPTPTPAPTITLLRTQGTKFIDASGKQVRLMGAISCCTDSKTEGGWPWASEAFMKRVKEHGGNHVTVRLGPNAGQEEVARLYDADPVKYPFDGYLVKHIPGQAPYYPLEYDPDFWARLRKTLRTALNLGLYVEISVIDGWCLRQRWPPWESNWSGIMSSAPKTYHKQWIQKVAAEASAFPNVIYSAGNENFLPDGRVSLAWEGTMADLIHEVEKSKGYARHLFGTNSQLSEIERDSRIDFVMLHGDVAVAPKWNKPLYMNEAGPHITAAQYAIQARAARKLGSEFLLWRGEMKSAEFEKALDEMAKIQAE